MSFDGELSFNAVLLHDERVLKIERLLADFTPEKWCKKYWHHGNRRCLGQMILDSYACERERIMELSVVEPILEAARKVTGEIFDSVMLFNDSDATDAETVRTVLEQARADLLQTTPRILSPLSPTPPQRRTAKDVLEILGAVCALLFPYYWYSAF